MTTAPEVGEKKRRLSRSNRREQLLDVAERLFVENGYAVVTMEDIARGAGVTRPVVYNHFETREGAYLSVVRRARELYDQLLIAQIDLDDPPEQMLARSADNFFRMLEEEPGRWKLLFGSTSVLPGTYANDLAELRFGTIHAIAEVLRLAAPAGTPELDIQGAAHAISGVGERLGQWWLAEPSLTRPQLVELYTRFVWSGLKSSVVTDES